MHVFYLDGSDQVGSFLAEVEEASNGHAVGQIVDKGHIVDQVVCLSDAQDDYGGKALWEGKVRSRVKYVLNYFKMMLTSSIFILKHKASQSRINCECSTHADQQGGDRSAVL